MTNKEQLAKVRAFLAKHKQWIEKNLKGCAHGIGTAKGYGIALRPVKMTVELEQQIERFKQIAEAEGLVVDVAVTGVIRPRTR